MPGAWCDVTPPRPPCRSRLMICPVAVSPRGHPWRFGSKVAWYASAIDATSARGTILIRSGSIVGARLLAPRLHFDDKIRRVEYDADRRPLLACLGMFPVREDQDELSHSGLVDDLVSVADPLLLDALHDPVARHPPLVRSHRPVREHLGESGQPGLEIVNVAEGGRVRGMANL